MWIVAVDALQLGITGSARRVGGFRGIPSRHGRGILRPSAGVTTAACPVDVVVIAIGLNRCAPVFDEQVGALRKETWFLHQARAVILAAEMACFTSDSQGDGVLGGLITLQRINEAEKLAGIDCRGVFRGVPEFRMCFC